MLEEDQLLTISGYSRVKKHYSVDADFLNEATGDNVASTASSINLTSSSGGASVLTGFDINNQDDGYIYMIMGVGNAYPSVTEFLFVIRPPGRTDIRDEYLRRIFYNNRQEYISEYIYIPTGNEYEFAMFPKINGVYQNGVGYPWYNSLVLPTPTTPVYNTSTGNITSNGQGNRVVFEYRKTSASAKTYPYSSDDLDYFYDICLNTSESTNERYWRSFPSILHRWNIPVIKFSIASTPAGWTADPLGALINWMNAMNPIIAPSGVQLAYTQSGDQNVTCYFGTRREMFGAESDYYFYNGQWSTSSANGQIYTGTTRVGIDTIRTDFLSVCYEEFAQVLGAGNDSGKYQYSTFYEFPHYGRPKSYNTRDANVMRLLYDRSIPVGESSQKVASRVKSYAIIGSDNGVLTKQLAELDTGSTYQVRAWTVQQHTHPITGFSIDKYSNKTSWTTFTTTGTSLFNWSYAGLDNNGIVAVGQRKYAGLICYVTAGEWNSLQSAINSKLASRGLNQFSVYNFYNGANSFTSISSNMDISSLYYNQICNALADLNQPYPAPARVSTGDDISASRLNALIDCFNSA